MSKNLYDYIKNNENISNEEKQKVETIAQDLVNKYSGLNEDMLMNEFIKEINKQKKNGTFNKQKIKNLVNSVAHLFPEEKVKQVMGIIDSL